MEPKNNDDYVLNLRRALFRYGSQLTRDVLQEAGTPEKLKRACNDLGLPRKFDTEQRIQGLVEYIDRVNEIVFLDEWQRKVVCKQGDEMVHKLTDAGPTPDNYYPQVTFSPDDPKKNIKYSAIRQRYANTCSDVPILPKNQKRGPDKKTTESGVPTPPKDPPTWPEIDRRSGKERRSGKDRRNEVDIIFKNKRFGKDRRSGKDRRKDWKPSA